MNVFESALAEYFGPDNLKKIQDARVGIAGLGGLGSNCALDLVRSGFRKLTLCDFDKVEAKNLNRQFYFLDQIGMAKAEALKINLLRINPGLEVKCVLEKLDDDNISAIFSDSDVVVEGFDNVASKRMITSTYGRCGKFFVSASGLAGWGDADAIVTRKIHDTFYLIGDLRSEVSRECPPCSPRVALAAAKQADCILAWVLKKIE
ncbi:MAG TPA: sulfur carrier protein ThiS adenylyltransferase ThiF [Candidatus Omnitrophica bacterium]|nr:sulfur carrier protein ThiS adenylyltransferase ThiF [Candidatus Omnitrophota bacterium]